MDELADNSMEENQVVYCERKYDAIFFACWLENPLQDSCRAHQASLKWDLLLTESCTRRSCACLRSTTLRAQGCSGPGSGSQTSSSSASATAAMTLVA